MSEDQEQSRGDGLSDHDLLRKIYGMVKRVDRCMTNHLHRHFLVTLVALTALGSLAVGVLLFALRRAWGG